MWLISTLILSLITLFTVWSWCKCKYSYFRKRNIPYLEPQFPLGNLSVISSQNNITQWAKNLYFSFRDHAPGIGGIYIGFEPVLVVTDLNLMRSILTTHFSSFTDRGFYINERDDPLSSHLFSLGGERWRNMRTKMSPTFSNHNTKNMFETVNVVGWDMLQFLEQRFVEPQKPFNAKYLTMRFICDSIGSCGFGLNCAAFTQNDPYWFKMADDLFSSPHQLAFWIVTGVYDKIARLLRLKVFPKSVSGYFSVLINETVNYREENHIIRNDFMNTLIQMKNKGYLTEDESGEILGSITYEELQAQAFVIFMAGFHTSRVALSFALFELAGNNCVQDRLREEIQSNLTEEGELTYDALEGMTYLQQVIDETLRKYPPQTYLNRKANADTRLPGTNYVVKKGQHIYIPIVGVNYDPLIYSEPDRFDPDRMSAENIKARHPCSFMPFGMGPRICIGYRFGLLQVKMGIAMILSKYRLTINSKTKQPLNFVPNRIDVDVEDGIWLNALPL